jgi:hypothetical protein
MPLWIWQVIGWTLLPAGLILLAWALFRDRSRGRARCPQCWYDMSGATAHEGSRTCPECGTSTTHDTQLHRTRRHWRQATLAAVLGAAGVAGISVPALQRGWAAVIPSSILVYVAPAQGWTPPLPVLRGAPVIWAGRNPLAPAVTFRQSLTRETWERLDKNELAAWQERAFARRILSAGAATLDRAFQVPDRWVRGQKLPFRIVPRGLWGLQIESNFTSHTVPVVGDSFQIEQTMTLSYATRTILRENVSRKVGIADSWESLLLARTGPDADQAMLAALDPCLVISDGTPTVLVRDRSDAPVWRAVTFAIAADIEVRIGSEIVGRGQARPQWIRTVWKDWDELPIQWAAGAQERLRNEPATITLRGRPVAPDEFIANPFDHRNAAYWAGEVTIPLVFKEHPGRAKD